MSIQSEVDRIKNAKTDIISAIEEIGGSVPSDTSISDLAQYIRAVSAKKDEYWYTCTLSSASFEATGSSPEYKCTLSLSPIGDAPAINTLGANWSIVSPPMIFSTDKASVENLRRISAPAATLNSSEATSSKSYELFCDVPPSQSIKVFFKVNTEYGKSVFPAGMPVVADSYINVDSLVYQNLEGASSSDISAEE